MKFNPVDGTERPYPSDPENFRKAHGLAAWLHNPYTGEARDARDIGTDTFGALIEPPASSLAAATGNAGELEWSKTLLDGKSVTYEQAEAAAKALGEGWRLPTRWELESILDISRHEPAIDTKRFPDTQSAAYWSCTPCSWNESAVWVVSFGAGLVYLDDRGYGRCVRAVRSEMA